MPVEKKLPPIRLVVSNEYFNKLVSLADSNDELDFLNDSKSKNLYDKLMKYTFLQDNEQVELRFFPQEASEVILLLLCNLEEVNVSKNYYEELIQARQIYKAKKMKESEV